MNNLGHNIREHGNMFKTLDTYFKQVQTRNNKHIKFNQTSIFFWMHNDMLIKYFSDETAGQNSSTTHLPIKIGFIIE